MYSLSVPEAQKNHTEVMIGYDEIQCIVYTVGVFCCSCLYLRYSLPVPEVEKSLTEVM